MSQQQHYVGECGFSVGSWCRWWGSRWCMRPPASYK